MPPGLRQLAATVLKKLVREHWTPESPQYKGPAVGPEEKEAVREQLPTGLGDESSLVRTAVAMAVAAIARWDCPQQWPTLIPGLVQAIAAKKNANLGGCWGACRGPPAPRLRAQLSPSIPGPPAALPAVSGSVRCLAMFVDEQGDEQVRAAVVAGRQAGGQREAGKQRPDSLCPAPAAHPALSLPITLPRTHCPRTHFPQTCRHHMMSTHPARTLTPACPRPARSWPSPPPCSPSCWPSCAATRTAPRCSARPSPSCTQSWRCCRWGRPPAAAAPAAALDGGGGGGGACGGRLPLLFYGNGCAVGSSIGSAGRALARQRGGGARDAVPSAAPCLRAAAPETPANLPDCLVDFLSSFPPCRSCPAAPPWRRSRRCWPPSCPAGWPSLGGCWAGRWTRT